MKCPKCGVEQNATRQECSNCGIVFARYQPNQVRRSTLTQTPVEPPESSRKIPVPFLIVAVFFVIVFGLIWTRHSREQRSKASADDLLNDINNKGAALREDLRKSQDARIRAQRRAAMAAAANAPKPELPADLDTERIKNFIDQCRYFSDVVTVDVPKQFHEGIYGLTLDQYPALPIAGIDKLVEFDPPFNVSQAGKYRDPANAGRLINVKVSSDAYSKVDVHEDNDVYHFGLGRRRVEITQVVPEPESGVTAIFKWDFDQSGGARLAPERQDRAGAVRLRRTDGVWRIEGIWRNVFNGSVSIPCR